MSKDTIYEQVEHLENDILGNVSESNSTSTTEDTVNFIIEDKNNFKKEDKVNADSYNADTVKTNMDKNKAEERSNLDFEESLEDDFLASDIGDLVYAGDNDMKDEVLECAYCGKECTNIDLLRKHEDFHFSPFPCTKCEKGFPSEKHLKEHIAKHGVKVCIQKTQINQDLKEDTGMLIYFNF